MVFLALARLPLHRPRSPRATGDRASPGTATRWTPTPTISPRSSKRSTCESAIHVGHSTGGGEVARYIGRHGTKRVAKAVLIGAVPPLMLKTAGQSRRAADGGVRRDPRRRRSPIARSSSRISPRRSTARTAPGAKVSQGAARFVLAAGHAGRAQGGASICIKAFSETDFTDGSEEVRRADADPARRRRPDRADRRRRRCCPSKLVKGSTLEGLPGPAARHVLDRNKDQINADLLAFTQSRAGTARRAADGTGKRPQRRQPRRQHDP